VIAHDDRTARRVGAVTLVVLGLAVVWFALVKDRVDLGSPVRIRVYFASTGNLREGAPLVVGGQQVGTIESLTNVAHGASTPLGDTVGTVALIALDNDQAWKVPANAEIFVTSRGLLSERYLEVAPPPGPITADPIGVVAGAEIRGIDPPTLDTVLRRTWSNMLTYQTFVGEVGPELTELRTQVATLELQLAALADVPELVTNARELARAARAAYDDALGGAPGLAKLALTLAAAKATTADLRAALDKLEPLVDQLATQVARVKGRLDAHDPIAQAQVVIAQVRAAMAKADPLMEQIDLFAASLARHEGSLGRIMFDPEFPEDTKELGKYIKRHPWKVIQKPSD
jgi:ABC-type transporter Mla subunit MlaD